MLKRSPRALGLWAGALALAVATGAIVAGDLATLHRRAHQFGSELLGSSVKGREIAGDDRAGGDGERGGADPQAERTGRSLEHGPAFRGTRRGSRA